MNIEPHTLDSLRKLVRDLQVENKKLRNLLGKAGISCSDNETLSDPPDKVEEYDLDQGEKIKDIFEKLLLIFTIADLKSDDSR